MSETETFESGDTVAAPEAPLKLDQQVEISNIGPCKKHIRVTVDRKQIDELFDEKYTEIVFSEQPQVRGFRPGKAPRKMIEKQYYDAVASEIKTTVLMASLEQLAEEEDISPLSPPNLNPHAIKIPKEGPFFYEFDIEVRPEFELPNYNGLKLRRPIHTFTPAEIARERKRMLEPHGTLIPKNGAAELDDYITVDVQVTAGNEKVNTLSEKQIRVEKQLALTDGVAVDFGKQIVGAKVGDTRKVVITMSREMRTEALRGKQIEAEFHIKDVKAIREPEMTPELLEEFGVSTPESFGELVNARLERSLEYTQRQVARQQVLAQIAAADSWELPQDLLRRQARSALLRQMMEMRNSGMSEDQIEGRKRILEQDALRSTAAALKEHFVLQKVADNEKLEIEDSDITAEIERIAQMQGESPRKVRARYEKDDLIESLATDLLERKALDHILASADFEDYPLDPSAEAGEVATVSAQAMPGEESHPAEPEEQPGS